MAEFDGWHEGNFWLRYKDMPVGYMEIREVIGSRTGAVDGGSRTGSPHGGLTPESSGDGGDSTVSGTATNSSELVNANELSWSFSWDDPEIPDEDFFLPLAALMTKVSPYDSNTIVPNDYVSGHFDSWMVVAEDERDPEGEEEFLTYKWVVAMCSRANTFGIGVMRRCLLMGKLHHHRKLWSRVLLSRNEMTEAFVFSSQDHMLLVCIALDRKYEEG